MQRELKLLDCTLRDGGYINDWKFGHSVITGTYKRLDASGVDFIEVGFIDDRRDFDIDRTIVPNTDSYNILFKGIKKKNAIPVAMIDFGTCDIKNIGECSSTFIDGIRVIFKKEKIQQALPFCQAIKEKGYKLFIQAISVTAYSDIEMLNYVEQINKIKPYAFSIVDTYGLLDGKKLTHYFNLINNNLDHDISMGYHAHNNFQLAFSNTMSFLACETKRTVIADSTVYGMGKSAGNCPSELIAMHMNQRYDKQYDINQFLEIFDTDLMTVYQKHYWGYKYNFYISALQNCHPNYVQYLLDKKTLCVSSVNEILNEIPDDKKLLFDKTYIENAYQNYHSNTIDDTKDVNQLKNELNNKNIVLLGPGKSIVNSRDKILSEIEKDNTVVIAVNLEPKHYRCDYLFISNAKRYSKLTDDDNDSEERAKLIITSNITAFDRVADYVLNFRDLLHDSYRNHYNALLLCLAFLEKIGVSKVMLAGFDGFSHWENNYYDVSSSFYMENSHTNHTNEEIIKGLRNFSGKIALTFITESIYDKDLSDD